MKQEIKEPALLYACKYITSEEGKKKLIELILKFKNKQDGKTNRRKK